MTTVVISQPMFFPWAGMLEQLRLADVFVHYEDVQFSKGSFTNRVQVPTGPGESRWMTLPVTKRSLRSEIRALAINPDVDWRRKHRAMLAQNYARARYREDMLQLVDAVHALPLEATVGDVAMASFEALADYFGLLDGKRILRSSEMGIPGTSSRRVLDVVLAVGGTTYVTGHGARHYLDHELFEREGVAVEYIDYQRRPYPQLHEPFDPHVTALDLVATCGDAGREVLVSQSRPWRDFLAQDG